jgi:hypothetical protein
MGDKTIPAFTKRVSGMTNMCIVTSNLPFPIRNFDAGYGHIFKSRYQRPPPATPGTEQKHTQRIKKTQPTHTRNNFPQKTKKSASFSSGNGAVAVWYD